MRVALRSSLLSLTLLAALAAPANALEIFGNPGLGNAGRQLGPAGYDSLAQGFTMGSTAYDLTAVDVGLRFFETVPIVRHRESDPDFRDQHSQRLPVQLQRIADAHRRNDLLARRRIQRSGC